jgi:hypothetical protein
MECSTPMSLLADEPKTAPTGESKEEMLAQGKVVRKKAMKAPAGTQTLEDLMAGGGATPVAAPGAGAGAGAAATAPVATPSAEEPKKRAAPKKKAAVPAVAPVPVATTGQTTLADYTKPTVTLAPALLEAKESPLSVERVEVVKVKLFEHDGVTYYREATKNKLYKRLANGSIGGYHGRWNPRMKTIDTTIPDSDEDHEDAGSTF